MDVVEGKKVIVRALLTEVSVDGLVEISVSEEVLGISVLAELIEILLIGRLVLENFVEVTTLEELVIRSVFEKLFEALILNGLVKVKVHKVLVELLEELGGMVGATALGRLEDVLEESLDEILDEKVEEMLEELEGLVGEAAVLEALE